MSEIERSLGGLPSPELPLFLRFRALKGCRVCAVDEISTLAQRCLPLARGATGRGHPIPARLRTWGSLSCAAAVGEREVAVCARAVACFGPTSCKMPIACSGGLTTKGSNTGKHFHQQPRAGLYRTGLITLLWRGKAVSGLKKSLERCWRLLLREEV